MPHENCLGCHQDSNPGRRIRLASGCYGLQKRCAAADSRSNDPLPQTHAADQKPETAALADATLEKPSKMAAEHRRFGFEVNPYMLVKSFSQRGRGQRGSSDFKTFLTGTLSVAVLDSRTEFALPFAVIDYDASDSDSFDSDYSLQRIDLQLRRYHRVGRTGLYAGALIRYSKIEGEPFVNSPSNSRERLDPVAYTRVGAGVVLGLRGFIQVRQFKGRVYWGTNLHIGRWLNNAPTPLRYELGPLEDADRIFGNIEFAKLGIRF